MIAKEIFRAYDIRGIVDETLTVDSVYAIGQALGSKVLGIGAKDIVIGRDGRLSGPKLSSSLRAGILATGCNVIDIGVVPTPVLYFASNFLQINSAVMLTGSHNPPNYNGLKIILDNIAIYNDAIQELYTIILNKEFVTGQGQYSQVDIIKDYIAAVTAEIKIPHPINVVVDCGNGAAGIVAVDMLKAIGCNVTDLYCEVDGNFPNHHPDPSNPKNLVDLQNLVIEQGASLGLAFDGDGDRLGIIDNKAKIIWPDRALMLFTKDVLANNPGANIIFDVKCSRHVAATIKEYGGNPIMWNTGHSLIKAKMRETNAILAAEMSGHMFFKDRWYGFDDALYTAARLIELLTQVNATSSEQFSKLPEAYATPELNIEVTEDSKFTIMKKLLSKAKEMNLGDIITVDGMRVEFPEGWGLIRPSNTTPKLVLRFEAANESLLQEIKKTFKDLFNIVAPELALPF